MSKAACRLCLILAFLLGLPACSGSGAAQPSGDVSVLGTAAPPTENTTAVEQPQAARGDNPGIKVASLPVGGSSEGAPGPGGVQCLGVNWVLTSDPLPAGVSVVLTEVRFDPDVYRPASGSCPLPSCVGFVFQGSDRACDLAIRPKADGETTLSDTDVQAFADGRVLCADSEGSACKDFLTSVRGQSSTLTVKLPVPAQTADSGSGGTPSPQNPSPETPSPQNPSPQNPSPETNASPGG